METVEVFTHSIRSPVSTTASRTDQGILRINFVVPIIPGVGEMHSYNIGETGQQEITKAITGGLHIARPGDVPDGH